MAILRIEAGRQFIKCGDAMTALYMVMQGKIQQISSSSKRVLEAGSIIGIAECVTQIYHADYMILEEASICPLAYSKPDDLNKLFKQQPQYAPIFLATAIKEADFQLLQYQKLFNRAQHYFLFADKMYMQYKSLCTANGITEKKFRNMDELKPFVTEYGIEEWEIKFYQSFHKKKIEELAPFYKDSALAVGQMLQAASVMALAKEEIDAVSEYVQSLAGIYMNDRRTDLLEMFFELTQKAAAKNADIAPIREKVKCMMDYMAKLRMFSPKVMETRFREYFEYDFSAAAEPDGADDGNSLLVDVTENLDEDEVLVQDTEALLEAYDREEESDAEDCLAHILNYAGMSKEEMHEIRGIILAYRNQKDSEDNDEKARKFRRKLTEMFYRTYRTVFEKSMKNPEISPIVQMFLNFGFMDVGMAGEENANDLYDLTEKLEQCRNEHVYTMYEWLKSIYEGRNEPCRNEFDLDYSGYLSEQRRMGKISKSQADAMQQDCWQKTVFEMENMFVSTNRATYGRISTFCPILAEKDLIQEAEKMLVTAEKLEEALELVKSVDFSLFYREVLFSDPEHGVNQEPMQKEIQPDIILMPNAGVKAMMWQETAGVRRDTAARFVFPILTIEKLENMMLETCGRYRWEICRKIQGMRWNDITDKSLTSEYCDYIQFYRKNRDLSADAKDKIKNALVKAKNNYREIFVMDYINWIRYESNGSYRLNKIARDILLRYCPFARKYREVLAINPMYQDLLSKYRIMVERKMKHITGFNNRYEKNGGTIGREIEENRQFYQL